MCIWLSDSFYSTVTKALYVVLHSSLFACCFVLLIAYLLLMQVILILTAIVTFAGNVSHEGVVANNTNNVVSSVMLHILVRCRSIVFFNCPNRYFLPVFHLTIASCTRASNSTGEIFLLISWERFNENVRVRIAAFREGEKLACVSQRNQKKRLAKAR